MATEKDFFGDRYCISTRTFEQDALPEVIQEIELWLKGCGFHLKNLDYDVPSS